MQELTTLNVTMRIITDKNIDQLETMNSININSFTDFDKEMLPILTSLKSEILQPSASIAQEEGIAPEEASEQEPVETIDDSINKQFVQLAQVIDNNFVKSEQEQAQEQLEEISLDELIPKPATENAIGENDIINPENSLIKFQEDTTEDSVKSSGEQSSDQSGSQPKVITLSEKLQ